ncbi:MAG: Spy/CpxP family protein refolding chaperone [Chitinophagaceae bacterium]|jgi:Spy/CpxP family protein refolding chaperone|nr:Spy/CpxP family protein refolding chaperone [Chitinophagaceae bacterium]
MKVITQNKWFLALLGILLIGNIALLLSFFVFGEKQESAQKKSPAQSKGYLARELNLDEAQEKQFREMKERFFREMDPVWEDIRKAKDSFYSQIRNSSVTEAEIEALTAGIAEKNRIADEMMFRHFRELRNLCTPEQQQKFDTLVPRMLSRNAKRGGGSHSGSK